MTLATVLLAVLFGGLTVYAVLGGADFGAGVLHLVAGPGLAGGRRRRAIAGAMGPVWEANHVWLIFFLTGLLTLFPAAFAALGTALLLPGALVLVGLVVRGAALACSGHLAGAERARRPIGLAFGLASLTTPAVFGATAGGLARGGHGAALWAGPFQLVTALLAVAMCSALAATFMTVEAARAGEAALAGDFRALARRSADATAVLAALGLAAARLFASPFFDDLTGDGLPALIAGGGGLAWAIAALGWRRDRLARGALVVAVAAVMWGWALAQYPRLAGPGVTVTSAAAPAPELRAVAIALGAGAVLLLPALALLYGAFRHTTAEATR